MVGIFAPVAQQAGGLFDRINRAAASPTFAAGIGFLEGNPSAGLANAQAIRNAQFQQQAQQAAAQQAQRQAEAQAAQQVFANQMARERLALDRNRALPEEIRAVQFLTDDPAEQQRLVRNQRNREERRLAREQERADEELRQAQERIDLERLELAQKAAGAGGKLTEGERKFSTFATLANQAQTEINKLENTEGFNPTLIQPGRLNLTRNRRGQQYQAAKQTFIDAIIRPMTGAAVTQFEFDSANNRYFPQLGDDAQTIEFKRQLRKQAIDAIRAGSGRALQQINGGMAQPTPQPQLTAPEPVQTITIDLEGNLIE